MNNRKRLNGSPFEFKYNHEEYMSVLAATQHYYQNNTVYKVSGKNVSYEFFEKHASDWKRSGTAHLSCNICNNYIRSTHSYTCPNRGIQDPDSSLCICNKRKSINEIPICVSCYQINEQIAMLIYGENIRDGNLYRIPSNRDYGGVLYTEFEEKQKITNSIPNQSSLQDNSKKYNLHKSASTESFVTDSQSVTSDFTTDSINDNFNQELGTNFIRGVDVVKKKHSYCFSCGYIQEPQNCIVFNNNFLTGNIHGLSHEESEKSYCPHCQMKTFININIWNMKSEFDYSNNTIHILHNLYDSTLLRFGKDEFHKPLNDFYVDGKDRNDPFLDEYQKLTNHNKNAILLSCISITKQMLLNKSKLIINGSLDLDILHKMIFLNVEHYTIEDNSICSYISGKKINMNIKQVRCPQVSPETITKVDEIGFRKFSKDPFESNKKLRSTIVEETDENVMEV